ncbi:MAG: extracellular solute-binding protein [bacterium]
MRRILLPSFFFFIAPILLADPSEPIVRIMTWDELLISPLYQISTRVRLEFDARNPDILVERRMRGGRLTDDRLAFAAANAINLAPDYYAEAHVPIIPFWIRQGFCKPLNDLIAETDQFDKVRPALWLPATSNGSIYGIPANSYVMTLFYRRDLFQEAGLNPDRGPETWDEMIDFAVRLTDRSKNRSGMAVLGQHFATWHWENYVWQAGGEVTEMLPDGTCRIRWTEPAGVKATQLYTDLRWKHQCIQPNPVQSYADNNDDFFMGRAAMILATGDMLGEFLQRGLKPDQIGIWPLPAGPEGHRAAQLGGAFMILNPNSPPERQRAAWRYICWQASREAWIMRWKLMAEAGLNFPIPSIYEDLDVGDYMNVPKAWSRSFTESLEYGRMEYYVKDRIEPYLSMAIQKVLIDENADCAEVLKECAEIVQREVVDPFNEEIRKTKSPLE